MGNLIDLTKKARVVLEKKNLINVKANLVFAIDKSGSMGTLYSRGVVQDTVDRLLAIGMNIDVDKSIDVYAFNNNGQYVGSASEQNHQGFINTSGVRAWGGTSYAPVMNDILNKYGTPVTSFTTTEVVEKKGFFNKLLGRTETITKTVDAGPVKRQDIPTIVFFVTDGENDDYDRTRTILRAASKQGVFWQFIGIGNENFSFLTELDKLSGREIDNANFFNAKDIANLSDESLYDEILKEIPAWIQAAKSKGMIS